MLLKLFSSSSRRFSHQVDSLASVHLDFLSKKGIRGAILDLDNTIVSEDDRFLSPGAEDWIRQAKLSGIKVFILSNGKRHYRVRFWSDRLAVPALNPAKKPFPKAFRRAMTSMELTSMEVVVIGDSLHTDVLGAWISRCHCIQVASLPHPPRWWEKLLGKYIQTPYPQHLDLWDFDASAYH